MILIGTRIPDSITILIEIPRTIQVDIDLVPSDVSD